MNGPQRAMSRHPRLRLERFALVRREIEHPVLIDELVAEVDGQPVQRLLQAVVVVDARRSQQHQDVR